METYSLDVFMKEAEANIRADMPEYDMLRRLDHLMQKLIATPGSIPAEAFASRPEKFSSNLLYRPVDRIFSVMGGNWLPGQTTPIHDHLTWAVVGVCEGEERESIYRRIDDGSNPDKAKLEMVSERINKKGHVTTLGKAGIHRIDNVSLAPSLSIHMYGLDIGTAERHSYDPVTGEVSKFVSGYCNVLRDEDQD
ncbi:cysteine dioxygenase family protein [Candidatus Bathyarchaeota archaeon]|nr:cysteine dioxygenase family protein [Candidatus Bathyarchaeota archaeon]